MRKTKMSTKDLIAVLEAIPVRYPNRLDPETAHAEADAALLDYIADPKVRAAYDAIIPKWYA